MAPLLECVVNVSEGRRPAVIDQLASAAGEVLLDVHRDAEHHRSVFTLAGPGPAVETAVKALAEAVVGLVDLSGHAGAHPRVGALDVVPWVHLHGWPVADGDLQPAVAARDRFAVWAARELHLPCFFYGPERSLPELRRGVWAAIKPDIGPQQPHPTAGATACGARRVLVAYNLWLAEPDLATAQRIASALRGADLRTLGLAVGRNVQVSCNLVAPWRLGPDAVYDAVASRAPIQKAELVGLLPAHVLERVARERWRELDLDPSRTIEARLRQAGLDGGSFA